MNVEQLLQLPIESTSRDLNDLFESYDYKAFPELEEIFFSSFPEMPKDSEDEHVEILVIKDHTFRNCSRYSWSMRIVKFEGEPCMVLQNGGKGGYSVHATVFNKDVYVKLIAYIAGIVIRHYTKKECKVVDVKDEVPEFESFCGHGISDQHWEWKDA